MSKNNISKSYITGATIIALSHILVKVIGALFRIPLANLIGPDGMAIYQASYSIYMVLFVISTAGIPVAISKLVAKNEALGNYAESYNVFRVSFRLLFWIGLCGTAILIIGAGAFAEWMGIPDGYPAIIALAPSLFFVSVSSVYRGFFQGKQNMIPTAASEVIESVFKLIVGLAAANALMNAGGVYSACGGIYGVTSGALFSALFLFIYYNKKNNKKKGIVSERNRKGQNKLLKKLIYIAVPITLGSSVFTLTSTIDTLMVLRRLQSVGFSYAETKTMFGYYSGYAITMFNLPATVIVGISISIVPAIGAALAIGAKKEAADSIASSVRITWQLAFPAGIGMAVLANPILKLLYPMFDFIIPVHPLTPDNGGVLSFLMNNGDATMLLTLLGLAISLVCLTMVTNSILQALDNVWIPVVNMLIGGAVKVAANYILVGIPALNIMGAPVSTTLCYLIITVLNLYFIGRKTMPSYGFGSTILKPLVSVCAMAVAALYSYRYISTSFGNAVGTALSIANAAIIYIVVMLILKGFRKEDIRLLPKGDKAEKLLGKMLS